MPRNSNDTGIIRLDDFSGGKNSFYDQLIISYNECASGSKNISTIGGSLTKMPGLAAYSALTATSTNDILWHMYANDNVNQNYNIYFRIVANSHSTLGGMPWAALNNGALTPLGYTTGTVSISGASLISATGSGTTWTANVSAGDRFRVNATPASWFQIASVEDNTHLTLSSPVAVSVATGSAYLIQTPIDYQALAIENLNGSIWTCTTANMMQRYDGTGILRVSTAPKAAFLSVFKGYLFGFRTSTAESRLYWSSLAAGGSVITWPTNNFIDIDAQRDKGTGMIAYGNELILWKTRSMYKVIGEVFNPSSPSYAVYPIATPPGFIFNSNYSAVIHKGILIFFSHGNVWMYRQGTGYIERISSKFTYDLPNSFGEIFDIRGNIDLSIHGISIGDYYVLTGFKSPNAATSGNFTAAIISLVNIQNPNQPLSFAWWFVDSLASTNDSDGFGSIPSIILPDTTKKPRLLVGAASDPNLYEWDIINGPSFNKVFFGSGAQIAISSTWVSKEFNITYGAFKHVVVYLQKQSAGNLTFSWSIDQGAFIDNTVDMTVGRGQMIRRVLNINAKGSTIQFRVQQTTISQTFKIYAIECYYDPIEENRQA